MAGSDELARIRRYVQQEREAALLYGRLAELAESDADRAKLRRLAAGESAHADHWEQVLAQLGAAAPDTPARLGFGGRVALALGRRFGLVGAMPVLERREERESDEYGDEPHATEQLRADEREHAEVVRSLAPAWRNQVAGTLRAGVFGISDGIVSNVALVLGVVGSGASRAAVVTAGIAGLVAGALSMATGEWVSVASQREVLAVGLPTDEVDVDADPWSAAVASFLTFSFGAFVPLVPFLLGSGESTTTAESIVSLLVTGALLYAVGAALSLLTLRSAVRTGLRQLALGWGAAGATFVVGSLIGGG